MDRRGGNSGANRRMGNGSGFGGGNRNGGAGGGFRNKSDQPGEKLRGRESSIYSDLKCFNFLFFSDRHSLVSS